MTELEGAEDGPVPMALVAVTVKVYGVPAVKACVGQEVGADGDETVAEV